MLALICWMRHEAMKRGKTVDESHNAFSENIGCSLLLQGNAPPSGKNPLIFAGKYQSSFSQGSSYNRGNEHTFREKVDTHSRKFPLVLEVNLSRSSLMYAYKEP